MRILIYSCIAICAATICLVVATYWALRPGDISLQQITSQIQAVQVTDRNGYPLTVSYQNRWNIYDNLPLHQMPELLKQAFLASEDHNFYQHGGVDWRARLVALYHNLRGDHLRGASTITEQVVRMLQPRSRNLWSKWLEGFAAMQLERHYNKATIFEFYLNQVPYAANRRGVVQASRYYFDRDLSTLTPKEMLALAVLARAPSSYDLYHYPAKIDRAILRLAQTLYRNQQLTTAQLTQLKDQQLQLQAPAAPVNAAHLVSYIRHHPTLYRFDPSVTTTRATSGVASDLRLHTTIDSTLQTQVQQLLDQRLASLRQLGVHNAAALVVDHTSGEVLAWVVAGATSGDSSNPLPGYHVDAVTTPRQPGSALKPFLYACALAKGWTAATLIDDAPYAAAINNGLHRFKNYSNTFYGLVTLREALANSLNIPALHTIDYVGPAAYLAALHQLGFSLNRGVAVYDAGLALGDGEVSLFELVQAYTALAHYGIFRPLKLLLTRDVPWSAQRVFSPEVASLLANILSDPWARRLEFGSDSVLNLPVQTAVKTGTSSDYHDAWAVGFNARYVVGIWMGNLDRSATNGVTGAIGPALALRSIFATLTRNQPTAPLYLSPKLIAKQVCLPNAAQSGCTPRSEYFIDAPPDNLNDPRTQQRAATFILPTNGLHIAIDPRVPQQQQRLACQLSGMQPGDHADWIVDDITRATTSDPLYLWPLERGEHRLRAVLHHPHGQNETIPSVAFIVR